MRHPTLCAGKKTTLHIVQLIERVCCDARGLLQQTAALPSQVRLDFDPDIEQPPTQAGRVVKTSRRKVIGPQGTIEAREIVRQVPGDDQQRRSTQLAQLVPRGANHTFDLIAHVGWQSLLRGQRLKDIQEDLAGHPAGVHVPLSTLYDQQQKFLFYLGQVHRQAAPRLRELLVRQGGSTWLLDATLETDPPVFLGIQDAASGILLESVKIPSENVDDIAPCLARTAERYGQPRRVLHDLSRAMSGGCQVALPGVPHQVCHYHLVRDVGEDLYRQPQDALNQRLRSLKIQLRMRDQRKVQKERLRQMAAADQEPTGESARRILESLLAGRAAGGSFSESLAREVLLAFPHWILDYRSDGRRRGYPFDPYTLYLHRRLVRAGEAVERLLSDASVSRAAPVVLPNFGRLLKDYRQDAQIVAAADLYERACTMFGRLREALWLTANEMTNLRQLHDLAAGQQEELQTKLATLRRELREQSEDAADADRPLAATIVEHLDKYWAYLVPSNVDGLGSEWVRTTNALESDWSRLKRARRRLHGRGKLTRDFHSLPEEYILLLNLENPIYVEAVLEGSVDRLSEKFSEASTRSGSYASWRAGRDGRQPGDLPRRLLRQDGFIDALVAVCHDHCQTTYPKAA